MTVRFKLKNRKWRGRTSRGWGAKKKRRGGGSQGGRGMGGGHKHKFSWVTTMAPDYFGRKGFHSIKKRDRAINVSELARMEGSNFDLSKMGYTKLLGKGKIDRSITVKAGSFSAQAKEKIEKAGGTVKSE